MRVGRSGIGRDASQAARSPRPGRRTPSCPCASPGRSGWCGHAAASGAPQGPCPCPDAITIRERAALTTSGRQGHPPEATELVGDLDGAVALQDPHVAGRPRRRVPVVAETEVHDVEAIGQRRCVLVGGALAGRGRHRHQLQPRRQIDQLQRRCDWDRRRARSARRPARRRRRPTGSAGCRGPTAPPARWHLR